MTRTITYIWNYTTALDFYQTYCLLGLASVWADRPCITLSGFALGFY